MNFQQLFQLGYSVLEQIHVSGFLKLSDLLVEFFIHVFQGFSLLFEVGLLLGKGRDLLFGREEVESDFFESLLGLFVVLIEVVVVFALLVQVLLDFVEVSLQLVDVSVFIDGLVRMRESLFWGWLLLSLLRLLVDFPFFLVERIALWGEVFVGWRLIVFGSLVVGFVGWFIGLGLLCLLVLVGLRVCVDLHWIVWAC